MDASNTREERSKRAVESADGTEIPRFFRFDPEFAEIAELLR